MLFPPPQAHDANGDRADCKRYARVVGGKQYIYTGVPVAWLADAVYPVTIDPDYAADTADGFVYGNDATYSTARSTSTDFYATSDIWVGQKPPAGGYSCYRGFLKFDTSGIADGDTVTQVNLKLTPVVDYSFADFDVQIVKQDWSSQDPLAAGNREAAYDNCLSGTADDNIWRNSSGISANTQYTSGNLSTAWVSKTGYTYYSLLGSTDASNSAPIMPEWLQFASQDNATSGYRPLLAVTSVAGGQPMLTRARLLHSCTLQGRLVR